MRRQKVRATINLPGLPVGKIALVDPSLPYIRDALASGYLIPIGYTRPPPQQPPDPLVAEAETPEATASIEENPGMPSS